jgi:hypothetical protein
MAPGENEPEGHGRASGTDHDRTDDDGRERVFVTAGLLTALLERAAAAEPDRANVVVGTTPGAELETLDGDGDGDGHAVPPDAAALTHLYLPEAGESVRAVFGVDLGRPAGRGRARFVSHPQGPARLTERDDLAAVVLVATPPWEPAGVTAYDRAGRRLALTVVDAAPPADRL